MNRVFLPLALLAAVPLPAQYALSAMAGYVHYTDGEVWIGDRAIAPKPEDFEHVLEGRRLRTGQVDVNGGRFNPLAPFGGYKQSGIGREFGTYGLEEFLETKSIQM